MTDWSNQSIEERSLLNPAFCVGLLWQAARGYVSINNRGLSFEESFLVLPMVLARQTREVLPNSTRTSIAVWLNDNPLEQGRIATRAKLLVPFSKQALLFGGIYGLIRIDSGEVVANNQWKRRVDAFLKSSSDEVRSCWKRSEFVGKWFALSGSSETILSMLGVRP